MTSRKATIKQLTGNAGDFSGIVLKAAARGHLSAVRHYLKVNPEWLNQEGPHGRTLLSEATYKGRTELVAELIQMGADINSMGSYYTPMLVELSPIAVARAAGRIELCELLEKNGATDDLYAACYRGDLESVNRFLAEDENMVNRPARDVPPHPRMGFHPIHYAVAGNQIEAAKLLVRNGADIANHLPLLIDWADGDRSLVQYLRTQSKRLTTGQDSNRHSSSRSSNESKTRIVPAIDRPDWLGFPPLVDACRGNHNAPDHTDRVKVLIERGASVNIKDHKGKTPLHRSCQAGFVKITELLFQHGANIESSDDTGCTPIFDAAFYGRAEVLKVLVERGANLHHIDARGETCLFAAARGAKPEAFKILLDAGMDVSHCNSRGKTVDEWICGARTMNKDRITIREIVLERRNAAECS